MNRTILELQLSTNPFYTLKNYRVHVHCMSSYILTRNVGDNGSSVAPVAPRYDVIQHVSGANDERVVSEWRQPSHVISLNRKRPGVAYRQAHVPRCNVASLWAIKSEIANKLVISSSWQKTLLLLLTNTNWKLWHRFRRYWFIFKTGKICHSNFCSSTIWHNRTETST